jgi:hypothetical protein
MRGNYSAICFFDEEDSGYKTDRNSEEESLDA